MQNELDAELAYFRQRIASKYKEQIQSGTGIRPDAIRDEVNSGPFGHLTAEQCAIIIRNLEANFTTTQHRGASVHSDYRPWLEGRRNAIDFYYWNRFLRYHLETGRLPAPVMARLDKNTDAALNYLGNPVDEAAWSRRGMIIGHVQSGKTTNYSALICKAADAGYKIIILLAGITNSLRTQTQERIDETFIGKKSVFRAAANSPLSIVNYADSIRFPVYGTSRDGDFSSDEDWGINLNALNEPIIFVTKKNLSVLESLYEWIETQNPGGRIKHPLLLIDDEADNASINTATSPDKTTKINATIRKILTLFERTSYVGYTATPFANIFIDPDSENEMLSNDLFPRHFIQALEPPDNYFGAHSMFAEEAPLRAGVIRLIDDPSKGKSDDFSSVLPLNHKRDLVLTKLPDSLYRAIRVFCLVSAIRRARGDGDKHNTMMINVSRFNDVQDKVLGLTYKYVVDIRNSVALNAGATGKHVTDPIFNALQADFEEEFSNLEFNFGEVRKHLKDALSAIQVVTVNMKGGLLEYSKNADKGLHVIAIGGLALSRGLTLEGLSVSYILRNVVASDTLMQMARWFGYRPGYSDLCRLYLPRSSDNYYTETTETIAELREEIRRMEALNLTPQDFGLRVRQNPGALKITAPNKMRTATDLVLAADYSGRHTEGYAVYFDEAVNLNNKRKVEGFLELVKPKTVEPRTPSYFHWGGVSGKDIYALTREFRFGRHNDLSEIQDGQSLFLDYVSDRLRSELAEWDVVLPFRQNKGEKSETDFMGKQFFLRERDSCVADMEAGRIIAMKVTQKNKVADPKDPELLLPQDPTLNEVGREAAERKKQNLIPITTRLLCQRRQRPLMIIHLFHATPMDKQDIPSASKAAFSNFCSTGPMISLSFCLPTTSVPPVARKYKVNAIYRRQFEQGTYEQDDDEQAVQ
jgi:hypothetical protein